MALGDDILDLEPFSMILHIKQHFATASSPAALEGLRLRGEVLRIRARDSIEEYIEPHLALRREMAQANYMLIGNEAATVNFIIRGLTARPNLAPHVPTLMVQKHAILREERVAIDVLTAYMPQQAATTTHLRTLSLHQYPLRQQCCD